MNKKSRPITLNGIPTISLVAKDLYSNSGFWLDKQQIKQDLQKEIIFLH